MEKLLCGCGYGIPTHTLPGQSKPTQHEINVGPCCRMECTGDNIPTNFRVEDRGGVPINVCDVQGQTITEHTLLYQRMYSLHEDGRWSTLKSGESTNSLPDET